MTSTSHDPLIVGITGTTGVIYGVRLLQMLQTAGVESHLILSKWAARTLVHETPYTPEAVQRLATRCYPMNDMGASVSSGSFLTRGMVVAPCSMRTLSAIAHGLGDNLRVTPSTVLAARSTGASQAIHVMPEIFNVHV